MVELLLKTLRYEPSNHIDLNAGNRGHAIVPDVGGCGTRQPGLPRSLANLFSRNVWAIASDSSCIAEFGWVASDGGEEG